jgi:hypothetical protein
LVKSIHCKTIILEVQAHLDALLYMLIELVDLFYADQKMLTVTEQNLVMCWELRP